MPDLINIQDWPDKIRQRYENYLKTSFFFSDQVLRRSFEDALREDGSLLQGPIAEPPRDFMKSISACDLAEECFPDKSADLTPALIDGNLYVHQEQAIRSTHVDKQNVVVATGTASGKTESFLYPILFDLYRQHLSGDIAEPGVRAMILYPMNALANDQRERLGNICKHLHDVDSAFRPTFGQYIGQTPKNARDNNRNAAIRDQDRLPGELVFREEMRETPPHILLTNYSMLEYLLIRPDDSPLFDEGRGVHWQFIVLDEAHQYRGAKGMEMGMLIRRLKQRLRDGGRKDAIRCIATSATISSGHTEKEKNAVAEFAQELFGEKFVSSGIVFGESHEHKKDGVPQRYHAFLRALEGAFLVHKDGMDKVVLNRSKVGNLDGSVGEPLEIALCQECGQHYYVGKEQGGKLIEANRDPSSQNFGVDYYLPGEQGDVSLCRKCGAISQGHPVCDCEIPSSIPVVKCESDGEHPDQLKECRVCGYRRGGIGDPVREIVHGADGPNTVIATALHELLPKDKRKILAFADSRQEAAFFAWYAEDSYLKLIDRNLIYRSMMSGDVLEEGLSIDDLKNRLIGQYNRIELFDESVTEEHRKRRALTAIFREAITDEKRLSLAGVGLAQWFISLPQGLALRNIVQKPPWKFSEEEARCLVRYFLDEARQRRALGLPDGAEYPPWSDVSPWPQNSYCVGAKGGRKDVMEWGSSRSALVRHFLHRLLERTDLSLAEKQDESVELMKQVWHILHEQDGEPLFLRATHNGTFVLNPQWLRVKPASLEQMWECDTCSTLSSFNIRGVCPRNKCGGKLQAVNHERVENNHYRMLYKNPEMPSRLSAEEHTAQIDTEKARERQDDFKNGSINLLSSSTTFEVGVDLGNLDAVFLRNVPPEPFNYAQRAGRAGRRDTPGLVLTYCRRNPHDLYHFEDPEERIINGTINPPRLRMTNEKIILRHMVAVVLSAFFKKNAHRFQNVQSFVGDWFSPKAAEDLRNFCFGNEGLKESLCHVVPDNVRSEVGLSDGEWIDLVAGENSRLALAEAEVCMDYTSLEELRQRYFEENKDRFLTRIGNRMRTIAKEQALNFLSRKAVIPKYGFPVDVVELDVHSEDSYKGVSLQRDLSQAIAEYAPGGKVVANKREWESCGVKVIDGKAWSVSHYRYDDARNFKKWDENDLAAPRDARKYLIPKFGFVTPMFKNPPEPRGRSQRLYTTRPFFSGFDHKPESKSMFGIQVTKAVPGMLVVLCEGKNNQMFHICRSCGAHMVNRQASHKTPSGVECNGTLGKFSLGHELVTDVVRIQFPGLVDEWITYSVAYALLLGTSDILEIPDNDLNVTIAGSDKEFESAVILYDNVPGGAGLVAQLEQEDVFKSVLQAARKRVAGGCGCDSSCYGCLRNYRNQFAHSNLDRVRAHAIIEYQLANGQ